MIPIDALFDELKKRGIEFKCIMHLGANKAQGRDAYIRNGVEKILWVEAIPYLANYLRSNLPDSDMVVQAVLSDQQDVIVNFNVASNGDMSSSIFDFKEHANQYPNIKMYNRLALKTNTLDKVFEQNQIDFSEYGVMIMDLQGSELNTLKGSRKILPHVKAIMSEVSYVELYEGAPLEKDIDEFLEKEGFIKVMTEKTQYQWGENLYVRPL